MGVTASLTVVPAKLLNKERTYLKPKAKLPTDKKSFFYIDKAWYDFHLVFREMPSPLCCAILGESFKQLETEDCDDFIFLSPTMVREVDAALSKFSEDQMILALKEKKILTRYTMGTYYRENFKSLKKAYRTAAKAKAWVAISIG